MKADFGSHATQLGLLRLRRRLLLRRCRRWRLYKIAPQLSLGLEGLFYDFGSDSSRLVAGDEPFALKEDEDFAVVRARLNYHFNSGY